MTMILFRRTLTALALLCLCFSAGAGAQLRLDAAQAAHDLARASLWLRDAPDVDAALDAWEDGAFTPVETAIIDFGFDPARFWIATPVDAMTPDWVLTVDVPTLAEVEVWLVTAEGRKQLFHGTHDDPFTRRPVDYRAYALPLTLSGPVLILTGYRSEQATQLPLFLETPQAWAARVRGEDVHNAVFLALTLGIALVSTAYLMALGFRPTGFFGLYIALSLLYLVQTDGYAFQLLWPRWPGWNQDAVAVIGLVLVGAGSAFARAFVDAPQHHPVLNRLLETAIVVSGLLFAASLFLLDKPWFKSGALSLVALLAVLQMATALAALRRGHPGAAFFLAGVLAVCSSVLFGIYGYLNPGLFNQDIAGHFGRYALVFETLAFSTAIFRRIRDIQRDRDRAAAAELKLSRDKIALLEAVQQAQADHDAARDVAERRRAQLAMTAHDIRQPLTSLRLALLRLNRDAPDRTAEIERSFDYLDALVAGSLEDTRPGADDPPPARHGDQTLSHAGPSAPEPVPASRLLSALRSMFADEARSKGIALRVIDSSVQLRVRPVETLRILSNLVSNAVKHTGSGRVVIGCRRQPGEIRLEIHDTGPGMTPDALDRVMEPYVRGERSGGTGLGLAGVRQMAELAGLDFALRSIPGRGTVAVLTVPLAR